MVPRQSIGRATRRAPAGMADAPRSIMSNPYPVHYAVEHPAKFSRLQLLGRLIAFCALGMIGLTFGALFAFLFLILPAYAASRLASRDRDPASYATEDGPGIIKLLRWVAALTAWTGLVSEHLPKNAPEETIRLDVAGPANLSPSAALLRVLTGIPSAIVLGVLCWFGVLVWVWAAITILVGERVGPHAFRYLVGLQRWSVRLLVYQASLVDEYPPFSFSDTPTALRAAGATA